MGKIIEPEYHELCIRVSRCLYLLTVINHSIIKIIAKPSASNAVKALPRTKVDMTAAVRGSSKL